MKEIFIHYLWENKLLTPTLETTNGEPLQLLHPGRRNEDAGPDFLDARIKIGDTLWAGNVEIHLSASDWYKHGHDQDKAYDNVILHVVYQADKEVFSAIRKAIPTLEVKGKFDPSILLRYRSFIDSKSWIACENQLSEVQRFTWLGWLDRMIIERLELKVASLFQLQHQNTGDWEETFYRTLLANLGFKVNTVPFEQLARLLPFKLLLKHRDNLFQLEALLFGTAGLLEKDFKDEYPSQLKKEFGFLAEKYQLKTVKPELWRFMRMRPANFPTIRLAQLAAMIHQHGSLFSQVLHCENPESLFALFQVEASTYWNNHFQFDKTSDGKPKRIGESSIELLLINTVAQILFAYGKYQNNETTMEKAMMLLESIEPENNQIINKFSERGITASNALQSQALLHLRTHYCLPRRCLECRIGHVLMKSGSKI